MDCWWTNISEKEIEKCPKCGGKIGTGYGGEYWYGSWEFTYWYCLECGYDEEEYYYDQAYEKAKEEGKL